MQQKLSARKRVLIDALAPSGRGRYDRRASASERARQQRAHLLLAVEHLARRGGAGAPSVAEIVACAGVGKNTFYEHFRCAADALLAALDAALDNLSRQLRRPNEGVEVSTPSACAEQLAQRWILWCRDMPDAFVLLEEHARNALHTTLHEAVRDTHRKFARAGYAAVDPEAARLVAVTGALVALGRATTAAAGSPSLGSEGSLDVAAATDGVRDVLLRVLR